MFKMSEAGEHHCHVMFVAKVNGVLILIDPPGCITAAIPS